MKRPKTYKRWYHIPIYGVRLLVVVSDNVRKSRALFSETFGEGPEGGYSALAALNKYGDFGIFLPCNVSASLAAHEVFHTTHHILEYSECNFDPDHHEQGAYLNGYLTKIVFDAVTSCKR